MNYFEYKNREDIFEDDVLFCYDMVELDSVRFAGVSGSEGNWGMVPGLRLPSFLTQHPGRRNGDIAILDNTTFENRYIPISSAPYAIREALVVNASHLTEFLAA